MLCGAAQPVTLDEFNSKLSALEPKVAAALSDPARTRSLARRLDRDETTLAQLAADPTSSRDGLQQAFHSLQGMLALIYVAYEQRAEQCMMSPGQCDYGTAEEIALDAEYPLAWSEFEAAATIYADHGVRARPLLEHAINHFTRATDVLPTPNFIRENLLGRAYCERELSRYDRWEYRAAIRDFNRVLEDGPKTAQYESALKALKETYAAMNYIMPLEVGSR